MTYIPHPIERIPLDIDVEKLESYFRETVLPLEPVFNGPSYYGWSLVSNCDDYRSGFHHGSSAYKNREIGEQFDQNIWEKNKFIVDTDFDQPTQLYTGYGKFVVDQLEALGFHPRRVRIVALPPGSSTNYHRDHRDGFYWVRLHIPIQTNLGCTFKNKIEEVHMEKGPAAYLVDTACMHQAFNKGDATRYHLICQIWDTKHQSKHHRYHAKGLSALEKREGFQNV